MAQHDMNIANQGFPAFRSDLNNALSAINSMHSGTSRPASATTGTIWLDTTNAGSNSLTIKFFDGTDDITVADVDTSANTINFIDSTVSTELLTDLSPQLGGMLDVNGNAIGNGTEELIKFSETASAVNEITVTNSATGNAPEISATGDDTNIDLKLTPKGSGNLNLDGLIFPNADGTTGQFLKTDGSGNLSFDTVSAGGIFETQLLHIRDEKSNGTPAGGTTGGTWHTRDLNTVLTNEITSASLSSNQITLPSGTYYISASAPMHVVARHKLRLRNVSDSSNVLIGTSEYHNNDEQVRSFLTGRFTIASSKTFELQHYAQNSIATNGLGMQSSASVVEVYADVQIWKVA